MASRRRGSGDPLKVYDFRCATGRGLVSTVKERAPSLEGHILAIREEARRLFSRGDLDGLYRLYYVLGHLASEVRVLFEEAGGRRAVDPPLGFHAFVNRLLSRVGWPLVDHWLYIDDPREGRVVELHPYDADMDQLRRLIGFCEAEGLTFHVDGRSSYFPGFTFRVTIPVGSSNRLRRYLRGEWWRVE